MSEAIITYLIGNIFTIIGGVFAAGFMLLVFLIFYKALRELNLTDLFKGDIKQEMSMTKFWTNIAYFAATVAFLAINLMNAGAVPGAGLEMLWLIYLGTVASNAIVNKWIGMRYGAQVMDAQRVSQTEKTG